MTQYYIDQQGHYLGGFDGAEPPAGAIEVPIAPERASDIWERGAWSAKPVVPESVTRYQGYLALFDAGVTEEMIEAKLAELLTGSELGRALLVRRTASTLRRDNDLVRMIGAAFGLNLDALFIAAAKLD